MGLISGAINAACEGIGKELMKVGDWIMQGGYSVWKSCSQITMSYATRNPMSQRNAWGVVTGSIYSLSLGIAASLAVLLFVIGWLRESVDIRNTFTVENMFRFFIRYALTASLIVNSLSLVTGIVQCATAVVSTMSVDVDSEKIDGIFSDLQSKMEEDGIEGVAWISLGFAGMMGGLIGGMVIIVCAISLVLSVLSRLFRLMLCIPFAPVAFAGFAGGNEFAQSGIAWLRTFVGYALEAVVIALAISISFGFFKDASLFSEWHRDADMVSVILQICEYCMPMIATCTCVKGSEMAVRRCLGLG